MLANLGLHLHRLVSRRRIRHENLDPAHIEETLQFFVDHLPALLHAERCNIFVYDPATATAWVEVGTGVAPGALDWPTKHTLIGAVIAAGKSRIVNDRAALCRPGGGVHDASARNVAYAPIRSRYHDEVIGVIEVLNKAGRAGFVPADLRPLEHAAAIVRDVVDSVFLGQNVYGATDMVLAGGRQFAAAIAGLIALGALLAWLLIAAWSAMPLINDAFHPLLPTAPVERPG